MKQPTICTGTLAVRQSIQQSFLSTDHNEGETVEVMDNNMLLFDLQAKEKTNILKSN